MRGGGPAGGKLTAARKSWALTASNRSYTSGTRTSKSGRAALARTAARSCHLKVELSTANPTALQGGVRGTWAKLSVSPFRWRKG